MSQRLPYMFVSVFHPASPQAADLLWLWKICMIVCDFILAVVTIAIVWILNGGYKYAIVRGQPEAGRSHLPGGIP